MAYENSAKLYYPLTKMNFLVTVAGVDGVAAFTEVTGVEATVEAIDFRQGNSHSLAPVKVPGLVKHGPITLKFGYTKDQKFKEWIIECVSEKRKEMPIHDVNIELIDINGGAPQELQTTTGANNRIWVLKNAWVSKYSAPDLNATANEVAIESVEIVYEELTIPN